MEIKMTLDTLPRIAKNILDRVARAQSTNAAAVITLSGELGSGKTTLTQEIARQLGVQDIIISPTFILMKRYQTSHPNLKTLIHIDAYRLTKSEELFKLGWQELLTDKSNLIIIEWPQQVPECIPPYAYRINLSHADEHTRSMEIDS